MVRDIANHKEMNDENTGNDNGCFMEHSLERNMEAIISNGIDNEQR